MTDHLPLQPGSYYHIYNRANGDENLFRSDTDYQRFLLFYYKYISPIADTFAWVLMPNHFHLLAHIKERVVYKYSKEDFYGSSESNSQTPTGLSDAVGFGSIGFKDLKWETIVINPSASAISGPDGVNYNSRKKANPTHHFSHLFNAYAKYVNEKYDRHGSLFQRPFKRKPVEDEDYLQQMVIYIHHNPVHHGFVDYPSDYPWSSYHAFISDNQTKLQREAVLNLFDGVRNFREMHNDYSPDKMKEMDAWLNEEEEIETKDAKY